MERENFDILTRQFAGQASRRAALATLAGAAFLSRDPTPLLARRRKGKGKRKGKKKRPAKVLVCHNGKTLSVSRSAVRGIVLDGGTEGACVSQPLQPLSPPQAPAALPTSCGLSGQCPAGQACTCVCRPGEDCFGFDFCPGHGTAVCLPSYGCNSGRDFCTGRSQVTFCPGNPQYHCVGVSGGGTICAGEGLGICLFSNQSCQECAVLGYEFCVLLSLTFDDRCCQGESARRLCMNLPAPP
jgi:hypothetical protein